MKRFGVIAWGIIGVAIVAIGASGWSGSEARAETVDTSAWNTGPMVQLLSDTGFTLVWYDPSGEDATVEVTGPEGEVGPQESVTPKSGRYECRISGLTPGQTYSYRINVGEAAGDGENPGRAGVVMTSPVESGAFRFLAFGDSGDASESQYGLAKLMPPYAPQVIIHTGDFVYPVGALEEYPRTVFEPYRDLLPNAALYPAIGNHDWDEAFGKTLAEVMVLPENGPEGLLTEGNYWFDYGGVRFICINSNRQFYEMRDKITPWLEDALRSAGNMWKVVYLHHPMYTHGKYAPSGKLRTLFAPLYDKYHVALVLNGHNHMYERSLPIRGGRIVQAGEGVVYVTTAAGGNPLYEIAEGKCPELAKQVTGMHSFTVVDVTPEKMHLRQVASDKTVIDEFDIPRQEPAEAPVDNTSSDDDAEVPEPEPAPSEAE